MPKVIKPKVIIYQKILLRIIMSSSREKTSMANQSILIQSDIRKLSKKVNNRISQRVYYRMFVRL